MKSRRRAYDNSKRLALAADTRQRILASAVELWRERTIDEITLAAIAERAGTTAQTLLRHFRSKDKLFEACITEGASGAEAGRDLAPANDPPAALDVLLAQYERDGVATMRSLALEDRLPIARRIVNNGRQFHRKWCRRVFAAWLEAVPSTERRRRLDSFVAATDLYLWKLLRRDFARSQKETRDTLLRLVESLCQRYAGEDHVRRGPT